MNFDDTPQEAAFRAEAKAWIAANAPKQYEDELQKASLGRTELKGANILEAAKAWQKKKADSGWACLHWPKEYGGTGWSSVQHYIFNEELQMAPAPAPFRGPRWACPVGWRDTFRWA